MSYDAEDQSELNTARRALGDVSGDESTELLTDDAIQSALDANGYNLGLALLAEGLAVQYAQKPSDVSLPSGLRVAWSERIDQWNRVASQYRALATQATAQTSMIIPTSAAVATRIVW